MGRHVTAPVVLEIEEHMGGHVTAPVVLETQKALIKGNSTGFFN